MTASCLLIALAAAASCDDLELPNQEVERTADNAISLEPGTPTIGFSTGALDVNFSHTTVATRTTPTKDGIHPGETLVIDVMTNPDAIVEFSYWAQHQADVGFSSLAEQETKFGVLWSSSPRRFSDEQIEQFKARFPTEPIPNDGRDHSVCVASSAGHCQFRWQIGTAEHLMDPIPDDDLGANVEVIITDDVDRDTPSTSSYFIAVLPVSPT